jgi:excisionase family DNA binding protein
MNENQKGATEDAFNTRVCGKDERQLPDGAELASGGSRAGRDGAEIAKRDYILGHSGDGARNGKAKEGSEARRQERLEEIDPLTLPYVAMSEIPYLPKRAGIYFIIEEGGVVVYIGQSLNIRLRWAGHHIADELCPPMDLEAARRIHIAWLIVEDNSQLNDLERAFIWRLRPRLNQKYNGDPKPPKTPKPKSQPLTDAISRITVAEAAKLKNCSKSMILQLIRRNVLTAKRVGPILLIPRYLVEAYQLPGQGKGPRRPRRKSLQ